MKKDQKLSQKPLSKMIKHFLKVEILMDALVRKLNAVRDIVIAMEMDINVALNVHVLIAKINLLRKND